MKIITLNLRHNADRWVERFPLIVELLRQEQADVIAFQEVCLPIQQAHLIANQLNKGTSSPYTAFLAPKWGDDPIEGIALLSRSPVHEHHQIDLPEGNRVAQRIAVQHEQHTLTIANTHLHHRPIFDESIRLPQMRCLLDWIQADNTPCVVTGDMNALPTSETILEAKNYLSSAYERVHGKEPDVTFPSPLVEEKYQGIVVTLDYIFVDQATIVIKDSRVIADQPHPNDPSLFPSDHFGLVAEIELMSQ